MNEEYAVKRYEEACALLPQRLCLPALEVGHRRKAETEELRLRIGRPLHLATPEGEVPVQQTRVIAADLEQVLDRATEWSRYVAAESIRQGHVTARGGFRVGICGTALHTGGRCEGLRDISSLSIRIPRVREGAARAVLPQVLEGGRALGTLILSPPGGGKTTLLRDLVRLLSQGTELAAPVRVSLVDERGELAAVYRGRPQLDVGLQTDILDGCPKALAVPMLLRAMNPQIIALDEIALEEDVRAVQSAVGCGAAVLATVHADSVDSLRCRPVGRALLESGAFRRAVVIEGCGAQRRYRTEELPWV